MGSFDYQGDLRRYFFNFLCALVAELVDAEDSKSGEKLLI
jgi:hypothetical protein